jgi:hypothetical protein
VNNNEIQVVAIGMTVKTMEVAVRHWDKKNVGHNNGKIKMGWKLNWIRNFCLLFFEHIDLFCAW